MPSEIAYAGNTVVPALLALEALGCEISIQGDLVAAARPDGRFVAADPVSVLGLVKLVEARSWNWRASDDEIDATLGRYGLGA
jgi:hypothetical protein